MGAAPGPACFGLGGTEATITDVYLLTGLLDPGTYLDGSLKLDAERSRKAVQAHIADPLGIGIDEALARMEEAYLQRLADALRTEELAPDTVIAAFGGAGPMSVCGAARQAGVRHVIIPRTAAVFSAFGIGFSDISQTYEYPLTAAGTETLAEAARELRLRAARDMYAEGVAAGDCVESLRLRIEQDVIDGRAAGDIVIDVSAADDAAADGAAITAHLGDGDVASLELSLLAPLPHVTIGSGLDVAAQPASPVGRPHRPRPHRQRGRTARLHAARPALRCPGRRPGGRRGPVLHHAPARGLAVPDHRGGRPAARRQHASHPAITGLSREPLMRVPMTEYLEIDLDTERWQCRRCGQDLAPAAGNYKTGTLVHDRDPREIHRPLIDPATYEFTFAPDPAWCRILEYYCPGCGTLVETEYLPPGHPPTFDMQIDVAALKAQWAKRPAGTVIPLGRDVPVDAGHRHGR